MEVDTAAIFSESNMKRQLNRHIPADETLQAALYCNLLEVNNQKTGLYGTDAYAGVTKSRLYFVKVFGPEPFCISVPFSELLRCEKKRGLLGQVTCLLSCKNGDTVKFLAAKRAGIPSQMPRHMENREKLLEYLAKYQGT